MPYSTGHVAPTDSSHAQDNRLKESVYRRDGSGRAALTLWIWAVLVPLLASLILAASSASFESGTFGCDSDSVDHAGSALLLTAHPDDEVMFFAPTILALIAAGWAVRGLCLSTGNSSGLGMIRSEELQESYAALGVTPSQVTIIDHPDLQDGMTYQWDPELIAQLVGKELADHPVDVIITFDNIGITHHPNHVALPLALTHLFSSSPSPAATSSSPQQRQHALPLAHPRILHLASPPLSTKFTGPFYILPLRLLHVLDHVHRVWLGLEPPNDRTRTHTEITAISSPLQYLTAIRAMMYHQSQLVWFRWLYLAFSRLMWVNQLVEVEDPLPLLRPS